MSATPITRDELIELVGRIEAVFDDQWEPLPDGEPVVESARAFGLDIGGASVPAQRAFADALGERYICALADGTCAAWGAPKPMPRGFISREVVFYSPAEQSGDAPVRR